MNPQEQVCHTPQCWVYGRAGEGHIVSHSKRERRYKGKRCGKTFSATKGTARYRLHHPATLVTIVATLLAFGCPVQAIVAAFGLDARTVADWQRRAGRQCARVHDQLVQAGRVTLGQVQADELRVRIVGGVAWLATGISVRSRLWLGGVVGVTRDRGLIRSLLVRVAACGPVTRVLLCTDGLASYPRQALRVFRQAVRTGRRGRPRLVLPAGVLIAHAAQRAPVKRYAKRRVRAVERRVVRGGAAAVAALLTATQGSATAVVNTASIERLNATFRARLAPLVRYGRTAVRPYGRRCAEWRHWRWGCGWWGRRTTS